MGRRRLSWMFSTDKKATIVAATTVSRRSRGVAREDALIDKARREAGIDDDVGDDSAELEEMRQRYKASRQKTDADDSQYKSGSTARVNKSKGGGPPGDFSWENFDQVKQLSEANAALLQQLDNKDKEINKMKAMVAATAPINGFDAEKLSGVMGQNGKYVDEETGFKDAKIVQLAKKQTLNGIDGKGKIQSYQTSERNRTFAKATYQCKIKRQNGRANAAC